MLVMVVIATLLMLLLVPSANANHGQCISDDFGPLAFSRPVVDLEPVDVSFHDEPDFQQRLVSFGGALHVVWLTEEEDPEVTEYLFMRTLGPDGWGPRLVVNNPVPGEGEFKGADIRVAGYDLTVHDGLLWFVWSTPSDEQADGMDGDIVARTFDGTTWGSIFELTPTGDEVIDITPAVASTGERLVVAWAASTDSGRRIVQRTMEDGLWSDIEWVTLPEDGGDDFNPRVVALPDGAMIAWHHRDLTSQNPGQVLVLGRALGPDGMAPGISFSGTLGHVDLWVDLRWHEDGLMVVWQRSGGSVGLTKSRIMYREWTPEGMGPETDITGEADGGHNGRPRIGMTGDGPRVYWHTNDDAITLGTSNDLVWRGMDADGRWGRVAIFMADPSQDMVRVRLVEHRGDLWAAWMANVTFQEPPDFEPKQVWDVFVGPAEVGEDRYQGSDVSVRWQTCEQGDETTVVMIRGPRGPLVGAPVEIRMLGPNGMEEVVLSGVTDEQGRLEFDHRYSQRGAYRAEVVLDDSTSASIPMEVRTVPDHLYIEHSVGLAVGSALLALGIAVIVMSIRARRRARGA
jgi:hypothetical protein